MNLLTDNWIPVRPQQGGAARQISLRELFCQNESWQLTLPRDDMELAALQLLICLAQVLFPPENKAQWFERFSVPLDSGLFDSVAKQFNDWFQLDHPEHPFMQVAGVTAKEVTPLDKLLAGLNSSTNSRFVNQPGMADGLCFGCVAIALYNQANNAPSFGGGFKFGIRGSCPVSTFAQGEDLRTTLWLNVLSGESLDRFVPEWREIQHQKPTWVEQIGAKSQIPVQGIGILRGLFWQPAHLALSPPLEGGGCSCCGHPAERLFRSFKKAKFNYTVEGLWNHPHSPKSLTIKRGEPETRFISFTQSIPAWTQLSRYVVRRQLENIPKGEQGQEPALVIQQVETYLPRQARKLELLVGGYRNNHAAIIERRHELLTLSQGWEQHSQHIHFLIAYALKYKTALRKSLYLCSQGIKEKERKIKGTGLALQEVGETQFYRRSEALILTALANINFEDQAPTYDVIDRELGAICKTVFSEMTSPYQHDPELFKTLAIARRRLEKQLREIPVQQPEEESV